ncbi:hypothetical protein AHAS_Ahas13G0002600 [Arachis hypogaea]
MAHSFTFPSNSKKTQPFYFRATLQTAEISLVAKIRKFHQHNIELSIENLQKTQSYNIEGTLRYYFSHPVYFPHFEIEELGFTVLLCYCTFYCSCSTSHFTVYNVLLVLGYSWFYVTLFLLF